MPRETRTTCYDELLQIEAYRFEGVMQKFPHHFHDYYVIGFIEAGQRRLECNRVDTIINPGDIILFNPRDVHSCEQVDGRPLDYRCLNIQLDIMWRTALEITGRGFYPVFRQPVLYRSELAASLQELHRMICSDEPELSREELYLILMSQLIAEYAEPAANPLQLEPSCSFTAVCEYMETGYAKPIRLDELAHLANMSKYHFLRTFTRQKGITPYCYLEAIRINKARKLLEQGILPAEAGLLTGFGDQSHFTSYFKKLIGLTPRQYMRIFPDASVRTQGNEADSAAVQGFRTGPSDAANGQSLSTESGQSGFCRPMLAEPGEAKP